MRHLSSHAEENSFSMKDTVKGYFLLLKHMLFQNTLLRCWHAGISSSTSISQIHLSRNHGNHELSHQVVCVNLMLCYNRKIKETGLECLPRRLRRWTRCHRTHTWPCAWGSRAAGGRASRGVSAWQSSDWGMVSRWRRRWRSGPEGDTMTCKQTRPNVGCWARRGGSTYERRWELSTCSCFICPVQRHPSSLWMQRMGSARICCSSSGSG